MTDIDYIAAFRNDDQRAITHFYNKHRDGFLHDIGGRYRILDADLLSEIFQEAVVRLWRNIRSGKLTENDLTTTLAGYLYSVGRLVAMEIFRRVGICLKVNVDEEDIPQLGSNGKDDIWFGRETAQEVAVRKAVYAMGEPCAPLLLMFYWDKLSWVEIASELHYKDANSAKTQKYKCIQKLKAIFRKHD